MKKILFALFVAVAAAQTATAQHVRAKIVVDTIHSEVMGIDQEVSVLLPPSFERDTDRRYPVLYLLHGMSDDNRSWERNGRLLDVAAPLFANGEATEMVIITPKAGERDVHKYQNGYFNIPGWEFENFFFKELVPTLESRYRIVGDRRHRAVAGLSMGGGGATSYGLRHPDMFCAVYAMSALMHISPEIRFPQDPNNPDDKVAKLTRSVIENSCTDYVRNADEQTCERLRTVAWFVDCGDDDFLLDVNIEFYQAMRRRHITCQFRVRDGGHTWEYWHTALYACLHFVSRNFSLTD